MNTRLQKQSILISYLIGAPVGLFIILLSFSLPVAMTGEGLITIYLIFTFGKAIIGLIISFLISLKFAGQIALKDNEKNKSLLASSFHYSIFVNSIIWIVFLVIYLVDNLSSISLSGIILPVIAFFLSVIVSTFSVSLLICYVIRRRVEMSMPN